MLQGRFDEAEQLLVGLEAEPEALHARVAVRIARGEPAAAPALLTHRLDETRMDEPARRAASRAARRGAAARRPSRRARPPRRPRSTRSPAARGRERVEALAAVLPWPHRLRRRSPRRGRSPARGGEPLRRARRTAGCGSHSPRAGPGARRVHRRRSPSTPHGTRAPSSRRSARCATPTLPPRSCGRWARRAEPDRGPQGSSAGANGGARGSWATASRTARSRSGCSSARRPPSTTSSRIYGKLGVSSRAEAAAYAARNLGDE